MEEGVRTRAWWVTALAAVIGLLAACGGSSAAPSTTEEDAGLSPAPEEATTAVESPLVGLWMQVHTCEQLVTGLEEAGLGEIAPAVVGDFFPGQSPEELAAKKDLCSGANPQRHFHFFDASGAFGSLDQHREPVDDGPYSVEGQTLHIGDESWGGTWTFAISDNQLSLTPVISDERIEEALTHPSEFTPAGWMVAVAYPGTTWKQVACQGWC